MAITGIDHVQLAMPAGGEDLARRFYRDVLGLAEQPKPPNWRGGAAAGSRTIGRRSISVLINALTCTGTPHGYNDKLSAGNLDSTPFCCAHVATTICYVPDRAMMCSPPTQQISSCASGTTACNGVCTGTQVDTSAPLEDGVGEVVSGASDADIVLTAQFQLGGYVFVQRWRFQDNGTIIPTMRLGGIHNCQLHTHQIYYRFNSSSAGLARWPNRSRP